MTGICRSVTIVSNPHKKSIKQELGRLKKWLANRKVRVYSSKDLSKAEAIISLGGDGTILSVASEAAEAGIPILGINLGRMGFLTASECRRMYHSLDQWILGRWTLSERMMLEVSAPSSNRTYLALNDAVIRLTAATRVTKVVVSIENEKLGSFVGDGVIVSTSTGSTAYSLSAQGPVVHPSVDAIVLTPICPHSLTQRPIVFPSHQAVTLEIQDGRANNEVQLCLDGRKVFGLKTGQQVRIRRAMVNLKLIHDPSVPFYRILRSKLSWGGN